MSWKDYDDYVSEKVENESLCYVCEGSKIIRIQEFSSSPYYERACLYCGGSGKRKIMKENK